METPTDHDYVPPQAARILVWHQGGLGDVLLAGPALQSLAGHYPQASLTLVGGTERLSLLAATLPVEAIWSAQSALWLDLFQDGGPVSPQLQAALSGFDLAVVFAPHQRPHFWHRLRVAGIPHGFWLPSFPGAARKSVPEVHREKMQRAGVHWAGAPFRLRVTGPDRQQAHTIRPEPVPGTGPLVALAPGSGHRLKNWSLDYYIKLAGWLEERHQAQVWWVVGPAEADLLSQLRRLVTHREVRLLENLPLPLLAAALARFHLFVGNDSGVTHLAAAVAHPRVVALFGPSDRVIWGPPGKVSTIITSPQDCSPCTRGREIQCPDNICMSAITPEFVLAVVQELL
ncbi:MAG: glycosyltransferase family 9 protein [Deltaproteobacteria bacterium]|nr:glycosyltransferase family 9 protein [Deltaproteobacteria bacterium]